jgi:hypothetical protein
MKASDHSSIQMHKRYIDLAKEDIAEAFGISPDLEIATGIATESKAASHN